jgi:hypothetical protein
VIQEVVVDRAVEDHDPDLLISLQSSHDFLELLEHYRAHDVDRRVIDCDPPIGWRPSCQANLYRGRRCVHRCEFVRGAHSCYGIFLRDH